MIIRGTNGQEIHSVEDWFNVSPPAKKKSQWKNFRSAKELAECWFRKQTVQKPDDLEQLLDSSIDTKGIQLDYAIPEYETALDDWGKGRNHDLLISGQKNNKKVIICIEAKADESYGKIIGHYLEKVSPTSKVPNRIEELRTAVLGNKPFKHLRYQLLHGIAGTLIEAKLQKADMAIFIIHEFHSTKLDKNKVKRNETDLNNFVSVLMNESTNLVSGQLLGPLYVPGGLFVPNDIPLFIGKMVTTLD